MQHSHYVLTLDEHVFPVYIMIAIEIYDRYIKQDW